MLDSIVKPLRDSIMHWITWIGVIIGSLSAISAIVRIFEIGLIPVLKTFIEFYRSLLEPLHELINLPPWPFEIPFIFVDLLSIYLVLFGMSFRSFKSHLYLDSEYKRITEPLKSKKYNSSKILHSLRLILLIDTITAFSIRLYFRISRRIEHQNGLLMNLENSHKDEPAIAIAMAKKFHEVEISRFLKLKKDIYPQVMQYISIPLAILFFFLFNEFDPIP
ncbi:hypothetical protein [Mangrovimonas sp. TPBH4]|uniref:hypothetical protein n=1 Tax=Mangrovimonas sp. TPBH4 TaxID=1645914 RepID=UPI0006B6530F|nr:hypothetical protein [Mangrovimonas sp. TPBH4]